MDITLAITTWERHPAITVDSAVKYSAVKYVTQGPVALRNKNWTSGTIRKETEKSKRCLSPSLCCCVRWWCVPPSPLQAGLLALPVKKRAGPEMFTGDQRGWSKLRKAFKMKKYHMGWDGSAGKETTGTADERGMSNQQWPGERDKNVSLSARTGEPLCD